MSKRSAKPLPLLRLAIYLAILAGCSVVAVYQCFFLLTANTTTATVTAIGQTAKSRHARYWADYEYFDENQVRHTGRAQDVIKRVGDPIEVQYLRHAPETSRPDAGLTGLFCFGSVAVLAGAAFAAEFAVRMRSKPKG